MKQEIITLLKSDNAEDVVLGIILAAKNFSIKECEKIFGYWYESTGKFGYSESYPKNYFQCSVYSETAYVFPDRIFYLGYTVIGLIDKKYLEIFGVINIVNYE